MNLNHKLIPQRNINMRFNLNDTGHRINLNGNDHLLEKVYFSGLQDHFLNARLTLTGKVHMLGICFFPEGFYPFFKIPVSEFKNLVPGITEAGFALAGILHEKLVNARNTEARLDILENELLKLLINGSDTPDKFRMIFNTLKNSNSPHHITRFCNKNNIGIRSLERMYNKYIGVSGSTYSTLNRFHKSMNLLLKMDYSRLSDLAYDNGYFDQMHFIKDFKRFTGNTPKAFLQENNSILQVGKMG